MSKFVKGIFVLTLLILTAGVFCITPNSFVAKASENQVSIVDDQTDENQNISPDVSFESKDILMPKFGHQQVRILNTAQSLSKIAYEVASGNEEYINGVFMLSRDIDLSGSLWTPIGTYDNPFKGIFYGEGHTILNINLNDTTIDANPNSAVGLFGNTDGASICDFVLSGSCILNTSRTKGSLVGNMINTEIINCHDETSKVGYNGASFTNSVGIQTNSYVFRGGSKDGFTPLHTTNTAINSTIIAPGVTSGYVGFYALSEGSYYRANSSWYQTKLVRVLLNTSLQPYSSYTPRNNLYQTKAPVLRENAGDNDIYVKRMGFKAIIPLTTALKVANSYISEIQYNSNQTISVYLNFMYGTGRSGYYSFKYDQTFENYFTESPYMKIRAGFDFNGLYNSANFIEANKMDTTKSDYKKAYPIAYGTYYYEWIAHTDNNLFMQFAIANDEGGVFSNGTALGNAIDVSSFAFVSSYEQSVMSSQSFVGENKLELTNLLSANEITFSFKLYPGYEIKALANNESVVSMDENFMSDSPSGVYANFLHETTISATYAVDELTNNDSYSKVTAVGSFDEENQTYTITVNNVVGNNGVVYLVVGRIDYAIDLNPIFVKEANEADIDFDWNLIDINGVLVKEIQYVSRIEENILYSKRGEMPKLEITTKIDENSSGVIIALDAYSGMQSQPELSNQDDIRLGYYMTWRLDCGAVISDGVLTMRLGYLKTRVTIKSVDGSGNSLNPLMIDGLGTVINGSNKYLNNSDGYFVSMNTIDKINVSNNGFYYATQAKVKNLKTNAIETLYLTDNTSTSDWTGNAFLTIYDGSGVNYDVTISYVLRDYDVTYEYYFDGVKQTNIANLMTVSSKIGGENVWSTSTLEPSTVIDISIALSNLGKGILYVPTLAVELVQDVDPSNAGYEASTITKRTPANGVFGYQLNLGTYDTVVKFYFEFREVRFNLNKLQVLSSDGTSIEVATGIIPISTYLAFEYNFITDKTNLSGRLGGISIHSQYYLLGWYLKNGEVVESGNYGALLSNPSFVNDMIAVGSTSSNNTLTFEYFGVNALVQERVVNVSYTTGSAGDGQFYLSDQTTVVEAGYVEEAGSVTYAQNLALANDVFFNLGHTFASWHAPENSGSIENGNYSVRDANWYSLFRTANDGSTIAIDENGYQTWTKFSVFDKEQRSVLLTASWSMISYSVRVDDNASTVVKIGQSISYTTDQSKRDGQAIYTIGTKIVNGTIKNGYVVVGYEIANEGGNVVFKNTSYSLSPANFLAFINSKYRFAENQEPITITTIRNAAIYKLYLENSADKYYSYGWNESKNQNYGGVENGVIYINVTYGQKPENLDKAVENKAVTITRQGYSVIGWAISNGGVQVSTFDTSKVFSYLRDVYIVPIWSLKSNTTQSEIEFGEDVGEIRSFYLTNSHDILFGDLSGDNVDNDDEITSANLVLDNGELVTSYGFIVTFDGQETTVKSDVLNIDIFNKAGVVKVKFFITLKDTLNKTPVNTYTAFSDEVTFNMVKNSIYFYEHNLLSTYNGTSEFVADNENEFGKFLYKYDWNGADRSTGDDLEEVGQTEEYFTDFSVMGVNFNAGTGKSLRMGINANKFAGIIPANLFDNVMSDDNGDYVVIEGGLEIKKAQITITFPSGSAYFFDGVVTIVYVNTSPSQFSVGSVTFTYNYSRILLVAGTPVGVYSGQENHQEDSKVFAVENLAVEGHTSDLETNFEWVISKESTFKLLDSSSALKFEYFTRYLTAQNGQLNSTLSEVYDGIADKLQVTNVTINGHNQSLESANQFSILLGNDVAISIAGNDSIHLFIYINKTILSSNTLSITVSLSFANGHQELLLPLAWDDELDGSKYQNAFDSDISGVSSTTISPSPAMSNSMIYAVLTDVVKVNLDYNGGKNADGEGSEAIFVSSGLGAVTIDSPVYPYNGISFGGFTEPEKESLDISINTDKVTFEATAGGTSENLKAKWIFNDIDANIPNPTIERFASENGFNLEVNEIAKITSPEIFTSKTYALASGSTNYAFNSVTNAFEIKNASGYALPSMSGKYTLTLNFTFNDGVSAPQSKTKTLEFDLNILINTLGVANKGENLVFNNTDQKLSAKINITLNGEDKGEKALSSFVTTDTANDNGFFVSGSPSLVLKDAGTYTITFKIVSEYSEIYQFENKTKQTSLDITIDKYEIILSKYTQQIDIFKVFGETEPNPISATLTITENDNDQVALAFTREAGEGIGSYALFFKEIINAEDKNNYFVNSEGFADNFDIDPPSGNLKVEMASKLSYIYNGHVAGDFKVEFNGTNYTLSAKAGDENISTTFDLYYLNGSKKIEIPAQQKEAYAQVVEFSSNAKAGVGTYLLTLSLTEAGEGWNGVDVANPANAQIIVTKRTITVTAFEKEFDQTSNFFYSNTDASKNTVSLTLSNVVEYDDGSVDAIEISGSLSSAKVGVVQIESMAITNDANANYLLENAQDLVAIIIADDESEINATIDGESNFAYGQLKANATLDDILKLISLEYNDGNVGVQFISIKSATIVGKESSNGGYLKAGSYQIEFTLSSTNFTFENQRQESLTYEYTKLVSVEIVIDKIQVTITNSTLKITKPYDGNANVLAKFVGQAVNVEGGYYTSTGILSGDVITIESATYVDKTIGADKEITLVFAQSDDSVNYIITTDVVGDITKVTLTFNKNGNTITFVDGEKEFGNSTAVKVEYTGDLQEIFDTLLNQTNFLTRVGYTQTGWNYDNASLETMTDELKEAFLQSAVDGGNAGITIDAIWQINSYSVKVIAGANASSSVTETTLPYYSNIESVSISANEGYTFEGISANNQNATLEVISGAGTRFGAFSLTHLLGDIEISIEVEEIEVKIILEYNPPMGLAVSTDDAVWGNLRERTIKFSELSSRDLPALQVNKADTFDFDFWSLNGILSEGANIWERINGETLIQDNLEGYTFTANWTEAELFITINSDINAIISVMDEDGHEIIADENGYQVNYLDDVTISISHNDWYKWTSLSIVGDYSSLSGDSEATNAKDGQFEIVEIASHIAITIETSGIEVLFNTSYVLPNGTSIAKASGSITGTFAVDKNMETMADVLEVYLPSAGTYFQNKWTSGENEIEFTDKPEEVIELLYGHIPTADITLSLQASFEGLKYLVTFDKGTNTEAVFTGSDATSATVTRKYVYGSAITLLPVLDAGGKDYIWRTEANEIFSNGKTFITNLANANCTLTMIAEWENIPYQISVTLGNNADKVREITADGVKVTGAVEVMLDASQTFSLAVADGYEIDSLSFTSGSGNATLSINDKKQFTISKVDDDYVIKVDIKASTFKLTINATGYETLSKSQFDVVFNSDITNVFDGQSFTRAGYDLTSLKFGEITFATYANEEWTFNQYFVQGGAYIYPGDISLDAVWEYDAEQKYISLVTTGVENVYYNASEQVVANTTFTLSSGETFALKTVFGNGERAKEVYYMLNGVRVACEDDFSLKQTNHISNASLYMVAVIEDMISGQTHTLMSTQVVVNLNKTDIVIKDAFIIGYYTGSSTIKLVSGASYGEIYYHDQATKSQELEIAKVEIIDSTNKFEVGNNYNVKYYFNAISSFNENNYSLLTKEGGFYTLSTSAMAEGNKVYGEITKTNLTIVVSGMGYENGKAHKVSDVQVQIPEYVIDANAEIKSAYTSASTAKIYSTANDFVIDMVIKNSNGDDITKNFSYVITGSYTIRSSSYAYNIVAQSKYFGGEELTDAQNIVSVKAVEYDGNMIEIDDEINYNHNGKLIFSIADNFTKDLTILVTKGETVKVYFEIDGDMAVACWTSSLAVDDIKSTLQTLESEASRSFGGTYSTDATVYAVVTDYKAILLDLGAKGGNQGYIYVKLGGETTIANPEEWTGFDFVGWYENNSGILFNEDKAILSPHAGIKCASIRALWALALPKATAQKVEFFASIDGSEKEISVNDILANGIENQNSGAITYAYEFLKGQNSLSKTDAFKVKAITSSNGTYAIKITASKEGYVSQTSTFDFEVEVKGLNLESVEFNSDTFTYQNKDLAENIEVTFVGSGLNAMTLDNLNSADSPYCYFEIDGGKIRNAKTYNLTLNISGEVFDLSALPADFEYQYVITVEKADFVLTQADIPAEKAEKLLGMEDPIFEFDVFMFGGSNAERVEVTLEREAGESKGEYAFTKITSNSNNFNLTIANGVVFTIKQADGKLKIVMDSVIEGEYSKSAPQIQTEYDSALGKWTMSIGQSTTTLSLFYQSGDSFIEISGNLYVIALENISFKLSGVIKAGTYDAEEMTIVGEGNFASFEVVGQVKINQKAVTITGISKQFDRTNIIVANASNLLGVIDSDNVALNGKYEKETVGNAIALYDLVLSGDDCENYYIANPDVTGSITAIEMSDWTITVENDTFEYGQIASTIPLSEIIALFGEISISAEDGINDYENGYIDFVSFDERSGDYSTAGMLKAGEHQLAFILYSENFSHLATEYTVKVTITEKELDLSSISFVKDFDDSDALPSEVATEFASYVIAGDKVEIDMANSRFENKEIGTNKKVFITLAGDDKDNYTVKDNLTGKINAFSIKLEVNASTEHESLVTDGKFVGDGLSPVVSTSLFKVAYPSDENAQDVVDGLTLPIRTGYTAIGWKYFDGSEYISLNSQNIFSFLESVVNDSANTENKTTIFTVWEIDYYQISVTGAKIAKVEISSTDESMFAEDGKIRYFADAQISITGVRGFKIKSYMLLSGKVAGRDFADVGNNTGKAILQKIASDIVLNVSMEEIRIFFKIDANIPAYTTRTDTNNLTFWYGHFALIGLYERDLPKLSVTEGTYSLAGYLYDGSHLIGDNNLQTIVDGLMPELETDCEIQLKASWAGEKYLITFLPNGGTIVGENTITATYGKAFVGSFPQVTKEGQRVEWKAPDGRTYKPSDVLQTIGEYDDEKGVWTLDFTAEWQNNEYSLTITFDNKLSVKVNDEVIVSGKSFSLVYGNDEVVIDVSTENGYDFEVDSQEFEGNITRNENQFTVKNLLQDSILRFVKVCKENTLDLQLEQVESFTVKIDGEEAEANQSIIAKTESIVEIVFTATAGFEFSEQVTFTGSGKITKSLSADKSTLTIIWSEFVDDATLEISAVASDNVITIVDASNHFLSLNFNGQSVNVSGGTFTVKTGTSVNVTGVLKYGFKDGEASTGETNFIKDGSTKSEFSSSDKYYHFEMVLEGFTDDFSVTFSASARVYTFEILVKNGMEECGQITSASPQNVAFGDKLVLTEQELRYDYIFNAWESDGEIISTEKATQITLDESQKSLLESVAHGDNIIIYATYKKRTIDVEFSSTIHGGFEVAQDGVTIATVGAGESIIQEILLGQDVVIKLIPDKGYEVDYVKLDGVAIIIDDYGYTDEEKTISIFADLDEPTYKYEVGFKASAVTIIVQAGTSIRYQEFLGTDAGGYFYATDEYGTRLEDSVYKENDGKLIVGADYKLGSYTDINLYFVAVANSGFNFSVSCSSAHAIINEQMVNGVKVYSFSSIKEDMTIKAIFIAKENIVKVQFALEGQTEKARAGMISVDATSTLVSASPNKGSSIEVAVMTSASLSLELNASLAYSLLGDENGYLRYEIAYAGNTQYDSVEVSLIQDKDKITTGYTNFATMNIANINADAIIYIYVVPQEYTLKFQVTDIESVTMTQKVRYGEKFTLESLTEEEYNTVFANRPGYTFSGYYTNPLAQGVQYINNKYEVMRSWLEDGYDFDGHNYVVDSGFDPDTNTFTLYAGWIFNKAIINVYYTPTDVDKVDESFNISHVITNIYSITAWTSQYSRWYAEILIGSTVRFKAIEFQGYEFVNWLVSFNDEEAVTRPSEFAITNVQFGTYTVKAFYNPCYKMTIENGNTGTSEGGISYLVQDGQKVKGQSFDREKFVTLKAEPTEGYKFLYWINLKTNETYYGTMDSDGNSTYTFSQYLISPLELKAVFVGKTVMVNFDATNGTKVHYIREVTINGKTVSYSSVFEACVGDEIRVFVRKAQGYGFEFIGATFAEKFDEISGYYLFTYRFAVEDLTKFSSDVYLINIAFNSTKEKLKLSFSANVDDAIDANEIAKAGSLVYQDLQGRRFDIVDQTVYQIYYGDTVKLIIDVEANYRINRIYVKNPGTLDATAWLSGNTLTIDIDFLDTYYAQNIAIEVQFVRLVWTMEEFRASTLFGGGTKENPFVITTEEEFAYVAYLVNNGITRGEINYAECHYVLEANLDFNGKYWEPIGTEDNPFNGTFDLGGHDIKNVSHYTTYSDPKTSYGGLFWHLGEKAKITQTNNVGLIIGIVGGISLLLLLILLIVYIIRKKSKKLRHEKANY